MPTVLDIPLETYGVWLIIGSNITCLAVYGCIVAHGTFAALPWGDLRGQAARRLSRCRRYLCQSCRCRKVKESSEKEQQMEKKVRTLAAQARLRRGQGLARIGGHILAFLSAGTIALFGYYDVVQFKDLALAKYELHQSTFFNVTLGLCICIFCRLLPHRTTVVTFHIFHFLLLTRLTWQALTCETVFQQFAQETVSAGMRFLCAVLVGTPGFTLAINATYSMAKLGKYVYLFGLLTPSEITFVLSIWGSPGRVMMHELFLCLSTWIVSTIVEAWNHQTVRANLQAKASSTSEETAKSLLAVLCDAVVVVDANLHFTKSVPQIANFLLRQPPRNCYNGASFLEFVEQSDRDRVSQQLHSSAIGHGTTQSVSTRLIDGLGSTVQVQIYCTCFLDENDLRSYVLGILEVRDEVAYGGRPDAMQAADAPQVDERIQNLAAASRPLSELDSMVSADSAETAMVPLNTDRDALEVQTLISR
eukprot:TRINITY_DN15972_c0_g1_i2.p1 TRINITY_DN15972_c0_g1~~TRINITY_DN15972_c0_g1_i2.p1  ORF type:complete len:476 (+),score=76.07 TRINITY_DN15972_c0_g1_i2:73-1500(+)